jgi:hypothetical protein
LINFQSHCFEQTQLLDRDFTKTTTLNILEQF